MNIQLDKNQTLTDHKVFSQKLIRRADVESGISIQRDSHKNNLSYRHGLNFSNLIRRKDIKDVSEVNDEDLKDQTNYFKQ